MPAIVPTPDATVTGKGKVRLGNHLGGTAQSPTVTFGLNLAAGEIAIANGAGGYNAGTPGSTAYSSQVGLAVGYFQALGTIIFDTEVSDIQNMFNLGTQTWTIPVAGDYLLQATLQVSGGVSAPNFAASDGQALGVGVGAALTQPVTGVLHFAAGTTITLSNSGATCTYRSGVSLVYASVTKL